MPATEPSTSILPDLPDAQSIEPVAPGRADDLISDLADQQIDAMMSAAGVSPASLETEDVIDAALAAEASQSPPARAAVPSLADELFAEVDEMEVARLKAMETARKFKPEALPSPPPPTFFPPEPTGTSEADVALEPVPTEPTSAEHTASPAEESSAEAVARELAADVAMLSSPLPGVVAQDAVNLERDPLWWRVLDMLASLPALLLGAINLPVQPLGDRGREIIGAIGIMTLVNAVGLVIYLTLFAHRH